MLYVCSIFPALRLGHLKVHVSHSMPDLHYVAGTFEASHNEKQKDRKHGIMEKHAFPLLSSLSLNSKTKEEKV